MAMKIHILFWVMTPYSQVGGYQRSVASAQKMETADSIETSVRIYQTMASHPHKTVIFIPTDM
jgi:hypothetical protein